MNICKMAAPVRYDKWFEIIGKPAEDLDGIHDSRVCHTLDDSSDSWDTCSASSDNSGTLVDDETESHHDKMDEDQEGELVEPAGTPEARSGHRIVTTGSNLYCVGGFSPKYWDVDDENSLLPLFQEVWQFNIARRRWQLLPTTGPFPSELASHTVNIAPNCLVMFGGTGVPFGETCTNEVRILNTNTLNWVELRCTGNPPKRKYGHGCYIHGHNMYVVGGTQGFNYDFDVHSLDLKTHEWKMLKGSGEDVPPERYRHEVVFHNNRLVVLGGGMSTTVFGFEKLPCFNIESNEWEIVGTVSDAQHGFPAPRRCHSAVQDGPNAYMCGGFEGSVAFDCTWHLDMRNFHWRKLAAVMPQPLYFHGATLTQEGQMIIFGGVCRDKETRTHQIYSLWIKVPCLRELGWQKILQCNPTLERLPEDKLLEAGIPQRLVDRLKW